MASTSSYQPKHLTRKASSYYSHLVTKLIPCKIRHGYFGLRELANGFEFAIVVDHVSLAVLLTDTLDCPQISSALACSAFLHPDLAEPPMSEIALPCPYLFFALAIATSNIGVNCVAAIQAGI